MNIQSDFLLLKYACNNNKSVFIIFMIILYAGLIFFPNYNFIFKMLCEIKFSLNSMSLFGGTSCADIIWRYS